MSIHIRKLHPLFAAEITGIDLAAEPTAETVETVEAAMAEYAVVAIRGSHATDEQHIRFSRAFGPLELPPDLGIRTGDFKRRVLPQLYDASNLDADGNIVGADSTRRRYSKGNELFHTDSSFNSLPTKWSLLYGHEVPPEGGNTEFIDMRAVYEALPEALRTRIEGLTAEHSLWHSRERAGFANVTEEMRRLMPPVRHPLVRISANGRKALYVGAHAARIIELPEREGRALLDELISFATQPQFIYSHAWQQGDLVIWDNRCTLHRATEFDDLRYRRDMRRTTINEYGPEISSTDANRLGLAAG